MKMYVECCKAKDKDTTYPVLKIDFGYRVATLFEVPRDVVCEMCDIKVSQLYSMKVGDRYPVLINSIK